MGSTRVATEPPVEFTGIDVDVGHTTSLGEEKLGQSRCSEDRRRMKARTHFAHRIGQGARVIRRKGRWP
jgi:hypothetical protein